jgi:hypothetical protein
LRTNKKVIEEPIGGSSQIYVLPDHVSNPVLAPFKRPELYCDCLVSPCLASREENCRLALRHDDCVSGGSHGRQTTLCCVGRRRSW